MEWAQIFNFLLNKLKEADLFSGLFVVILVSIVSLVRYIIKETVKRNERKSRAQNISYIEKYRDNEDGRIYSGNENKPKQSSDEINEMVCRFKYIYQLHSIHINEVYLFASNQFKLRLIDFKDNESILNVLDEELINWTCSTFGIQKEWLYGRSSNVYPNRKYYKDISSLIVFVKELKERYGNVTIEFFKSGPLISNDDNNNQKVVLLISCKVNEGEFTFRKYYPVIDTWEWGYWRSRYQLKSFIFACINSNITTEPEGYDVTETELLNLVSRQKFPQKVLGNKIRIITWFPSDYVTNPNNHTAKEIYEYDNVIQYFEEQGYRKYLN